MPNAPKISIFIICVSIVKRDSKSEALFVYTMQFFTYPLASRFHDKSFVR